MPTTKARIDVAPTPGLRSVTVHNDGLHRIRGLYAVTPETADTAWLERRVGDAIAGGARVVQYRSKAEEPSLRRRQAHALLALCRAGAVPLIINDDFELACAIGADGVHLGREDAPVSAARAALGTGMLIGVSCYNDVRRALDAERAGADYVAFGSFFPSPVKPDAVHAPINLLRLARKQVALPVVAIGGITADNAAQLIAAGADAVAVISALFQVADTRAAAQTFSAAFATLPQVFPD